jgi:hypothetical protein
MRRFRDAVGFEHRRAETIFELFQRRRGQCCATRSYEAQSNPGRRMVRRRTHQKDFVDGGHG